MSTMYVNNIAPLEGTTINVASGNTLNASAGFTPPAGYVINHYQHKFTNTTQITAASYTDASGSSFSYTPVSNNSILQITVHAQINIFEASGQAASGAFRIVVDGSALDNSSAEYEIYAYIASSGEINDYRRYSKTAQYTNSSTSAKTIKIQGYNRSGDRFTFNYGNNFYSYIVVQEIAQ